MQIAVEISPEEIIGAIKEMDVDELEEIKTALIERDIYFKKYRKDKIENVIEDFRKEGYSQGFMKDLENGLRKASVYNEDKRT